MSREIKFVPKGHSLVKEGDEGDNAYLIQAGKFVVFRTTRDLKRVELSVLEPGDIFGEMALFNQKMRTASVEAQEDSYVIEFSQSLFHKKLQRSDVTVQAVFKMMVRRLLVSNDLQSDLRLQKYIDEALRDIMTEIEHELTDKDYEKFKGEVDDMIKGLKERVTFYKEHQYRL
ncbi:MAG: cyclic nucleotide-binding domain-containing protein [Pseudobdellovibrionaceae bacterium]